MRQGAASRLASLLLGQDPLVPQGGLDPGRQVEQVGGFGLPHPRVVIPFDGFDAPLDALQIALLFTQQPLDHPFAYALVRLDGADTPFLHVVDAGDEGSMQTGMRVKARWADETTGVITDFVFVPA